MSKAKIPKKVKLICGFIYKDEEKYKEAKEVIEEKYGDIDCESPEMEFVYTDYYEEEMGKGLKKRIVSFKEPVGPDILADVKNFTNTLELKFSRGSSRNREINIDPGLLNLSRLILASAKDFAHRIYLRDGIFAEVTLRYTDKRFTTLPWTYPDFASEDYMKTLEKIRKIYKQQQKTL